MKLHLGCGKRHWPGWINVDGFDPRADVRMDIRKLDYPDNSADDIAAIHVIEHFEVWEVAGILSDWRRVLKPGGTLALEFPDLDKVLKMFGSLGSDSINNLTYGGLYGDFRERRPEMTHKWCYNQATMSALLESVGFRKIRFKEAIYHVKERDLRVVAIK